MVSSPDRVAGMTSRTPARAADELVEVAPGLSLATWTRTRPGVESWPVVLLHGGPGLWTDFDDLVHLLDRVGVVHSYDQRGCGRSISAPGVEVHQTMDDAVADLEALRRHWGHDCWVVVGHSFGADLALAYAAAHPESTVAVAHLAGRGIGDRTAERAEQRRRLGDLAPRLDELTATRDRSWKDEVEWRQLSWISDYADLDTGWQHSRAQATADLPINLYANHLLSPADANVIGWAAATSCPVFFIHGSADPRPVGNVLDLAARTPRPRKRVIQGAGHFPWVERPAETAELLHEVVHGS